MLANEPISRVVHAELPRLPSALYRPSTLGGLAFIVFTVLLWWLPALAAQQLVLAGMWPWGLRLLAAVPLWCCAAQGMQMAGFVGHEGFHFSLLPNRYASVIVGILVSAPLGVFVQAGVAIDHFNHHRHTNDPELDPDVRLFGRQTSLLARALLTRIRANRAFLVDAVRLVLGKPLPMNERNLPFSRPIYRRLAAFNLLACALWLAAYGYWAVRDWASCATLVLVPLLFASCYSGLRPYLEHADTDSRATSCARSRTHRLFTLLYFGNNLHLEHHLYPSVPCYRLPRVHRLLVEGGHLGIEHASFEPRLLGSYAHARGAEPYGRPLEDR